MITRYAKDYYTVSHRQQAVDAFAVIYHLNRDCAMVDLRRIEGSYKVLLLPGCAQIDPRNGSNHPGPAGGRGHRHHDSLFPPRWTSITKSLTRPFPAC